MTVLTLKELGMSFPTFQDRFPDAEKFYFSRDISPHTQMHDNIPEEVGRLAIIGQDVFFLPAPGVVVRTEPGRFVFESGSLRALLSAWCDDNPLGYVVVRHNPYRGSYLDWSWEPALRPN